MKGATNACPWRVAAGLTLLTALGVSATAGKPQPPPPTTPDKIVFTEASAKGEYFLWRMDSNGASKTQLIPDHAYNSRPSLSRTLSPGRIAHLTWRDDGSANGAQAITLVNLDGSAKVRLYETQGDEDSDSILYPAEWTPDDRLVFFVTMDPQYRAVLAYARPDGVGYPLTFDSTDANGFPLLQAWDTGKVPNLPWGPFVYGEHIRTIFGFLPDVREGGPLDGYRGLYSFTWDVAGGYDYVAVVVDTTACLPAPAPLPPPEQVFPERDGNGQVIVHTLAQGSVLNWSPVLVAGKYRAALPTRPIQVMDVGRDPVTGLPAGIPFDRTTVGVPLSTDTILKMGGLMAWAPDGSALVYEGNVEGGTKSQVDYEIYTMPVPPVLGPLQTPSCLTNNNLNDVHPAWWMPPVQ